VWPITQWAHVSLVRFCDDFVMVFEDFLDCVRVREGLESDWQSSV